MVTVILSIILAVVLLFFVFRKEIIYEYATFIVVVYGSLSGLLIGFILAFFVFPSIAQESNYKKKTEEIKLKPIEENYYLYKSDDDIFFLTSNGSIKRINSYNCEFDFHKKREAALQKFEKIAKKGFFRKNFMLLYNKESYNFKIPKESIYTFSAEKMLIKEKANQ